MISYTCSRKFYLDLNYQELIELPILYYTQATCPLTLLLKTSHVVGTSF